MSGRWVQVTPIDNDDRLAESNLVKERALLTERARLERAVVEATKELRQYKDFSVKQLQVIDQLYTATDALLQFEQEHKS